MMMTAHGMVKSDVILDHKEVIHLIECMFYEKAGIKDNRPATQAPTVIKHTIANWYVDAGRDRDSHVNYEIVREASDIEAKIFAAIQLLKVYLGEKI